MKSTVILFCLGLLCLMLPGSLWADTIYTYTGNPYTNCTGVYYCGPGDTRPLSLSITFDVPLAGDQLDNLPYGFVPVSSFSITDGTGLYITGANDLFGPSEFLIATGPTGAITTWFIEVYAYEFFPPPTGDLDFDSTSVRDASFVTCTICGPTTIGLAETFNPGVWSSSSTPSLEPSAATAIPEPSTFVMLGALLGILALRAATPKAGAKSSKLPPIN